MSVTGETPSKRDHILERLTSLQEFPDFHFSGEDLNLSPHCICLSQLVRSLSYLQATRPGISGSYMTKALWQLPFAKTKCYCSNKAGVTTISITKLFYFIFCIILNKNFMSSRKCS